MEHLITSFTQQIRSLIIICLTILSFGLQAQAPQAFKYQAVLRDANGVPYNSVNAIIKFSILQGSTSGNVVYQETHTTTTSDGGLISLNIGLGTVLNGVFNSISWGQNDYFIKVEVDTTGNGSSYIEMGTSQLLSVPYSLYSIKAARADTANNATKANNANYATNAGTATNATNANYATNAGTANTAATATNAINAENAINANYSTNAETATNANYATSAGIANTATNAVNADKADTADFSNKSAGVPEYTWEELNNLTQSSNNFIPGNMAYVSDRGRLAFYTLLNGEPSWIMLPGCSELTIADAGDDALNIQEILQHELYGNEPGPGNTGLWSSVPEGSFLNINSPNATFMGQANTTYKLFWTITNNCFETSSDSITVSFCPTPVNANAGPDKNINGTSTTLQANSATGYTGNWTIVSGTGGTIANPSSPNSTFTGSRGQTYVLRWTLDAGECGSSHDDVSIHFCPALPQNFTAGPDQVISNGTTTTTLAGTPPGTGNTGLWTIISGTGGSIANPSKYNSTFTGSLNKVYKLQWKVSNQCGSVSDNVTITFSESLQIANAGEDELRACNPYTLQGNIPIGSNTGLWQIISGNGGSISNPSLYNSAFTGTKGNTYKLKWTITNFGGQSNSDTVTIKFEPSLSNVTAGNYPNVEGTSVQLNGSQPLANETGKWEIISGEGGSFENNILYSTIFTGLRNNNYVLQWQVSNNCTSDSAIATVYFCPVQTVANAGPNKNNACFPYTLQGNNPGAGNTGTWSVISGSGGSFSNPNQYNAVFSGNKGSSYVLQWKITNSCGWVSTSQVTLQFTPEVTNAVAGNDQINVQGTSVNLNANSPGTGETGLWSITSGTGGHFGSGSQTSTNPNAVFHGLDEHAYTLEWKISNNCYNSTDYVTISFGNAWVCGTDFIDTRDNQVYPTVQIGSQCWMAKNLNFGTQIFSGQAPSNNEIIEKYCYQNDADNCNVYGGLYLWNEAMNYSTISGSQGICPDGWVIPTTVDWQALKDFASPEPACKLKSDAPYAWTNLNCITNEYGFSVLGSGKLDGVNYMQLMGAANFWTPDEESSSNSKYITFIGGSTTFHQLNMSKNNGLSVRCIKQN